LEIKELDSANGLSCQVPVSDDMTLGTEWSADPPTFQSHTLVHLDVPGLKQPRSTFRALVLRLPILHDSPGACGRRFTEHRTPDTGGKDLNVGPRNITAGRRAAGPIGIAAAEGGAWTATCPDCHTITVSAPAFLSCRWRDRSGSLDEEMGIVPQPVQQTCSACRIIAATGSARRRAYVVSLRVAPRQFLGNLECNAAPSVRSVRNTTASLAAPSRKEPGGCPLYRILHSCSSPTPAPARCHRRHGPPEHTHGISRETPARSAHRQVSVAPQQERKDDERPSDVRHEQAPCVSPSRFRQSGTGAGQTACSTSSLNADIVRVNPPGRPTGNE
jgi:hypothetical protein